MEDDFGARLPREKIPCGQWTAFFPIPASQGFKGIWLQQKGALSTFFKFMWILIA
jgi:hypothetical protein